MIEGISGNFFIGIPYRDFTENPTTLHILHRTDIAARLFLRAPLCDKNSCRVCSI